jgi:hypothetical protein
MVGYLLLEPSSEGEKVRYVNSSGGQNKVTATPRVDNGKEAYPESCLSRVTAAFGIVEGMV